MMRTNVYSSLYCNSATLYNIDSVIKRFTSSLPLSTNEFKYSSLTSFSALANGPRSPPVVLDGVTETIIEGKA
jgi:hypothetical protein